ncbi:MAG: hypothetical protein HYX53_01660 [Chloroflexi bacterium]|nr:hypothetical protein [Chloroflexota bacterium]
MFPDVHSRRPLLIGGILIAVALLAAGGALALRLQGSEGVVLTTTSTYTEGVAGSWQRINPLFASSNQVDEDLSRLVFSGLVRLGPDGTVEPDLADLPDITDDGKTYTFQLRKGLTWQDNAPITSRDVSFTIASVADPDFKGEAALAELWSGVVVETPDSATVVFRLKQASAPFLARNATLGILPEHLLSGLSAQALADAPFNSLPIGSGPFRVQSLDSKEAVLAASDSYYLGRPGIDTLKLRFYPDYPSALRAISAGEVDGLLMREAPGEAQLTDISKLKGMKAEQLQRAAYIVLYLNNDGAAFQDERVRRALSLAIDRGTITSRVLFGAATPSASAIAPGTWAYAADFDSTAVDLEQAKKLLTDAGWVPHPTTGIRIKDGVEFRFTIRTDNDPTRVAIAGEIARQLEPLGIRATVASTTFSVLRRDFLQDRKYDAAVAGWDQGADPDPYFGWHSSQMGSAGLNLANFGDVVSDELIAKARTTSDTEVRKGQYRQFQQKWEELAPSVIIAYPRYVYVHTNALKGFTAGVLFTGADRFIDVQKWQK